MKLCYESNGGYAINCEEIDENTGLPFMVVGQSRIECAENYIRWKSL
jgi:hypothetical protein